MGQCFMCGHDTQTQLDSGEWICRDCVEKIGGYKHWFEIKTLPAEQIRYMVESCEEQVITDHTEKVIAQNQGCLKYLITRPVFWAAIITGIFIIVYPQGIRSVSNTKVASTPTTSVTITKTPTQTPRPTKAPEDGAERYVDASDVRLLESMGLSEVHVMDVRKPNDKMQVIRARIFDDYTMQLNITTENGKIIYVQLTGIKADVLSMSSKWNGKAEVDMYSDTEGGVMATLNWQNRSMKIIKNSKY